MGYLVQVGINNVAVFTERVIGSQLSAILSAFVSAYCRWNKPTFHTIYLIIYLQFLVILFKTYICFYLHIMNGYVKKLSVYIAFTDKMSSCSLLKLRDVGRWMNQIPFTETQSYIIFIDFLVFPLPEVSKQIVNESSRLQIGMLL